MAEYIDRKALIYAICTDTQPFNTGSVMRAINDQPAADVAPVRHGKWLLRHVGHGHYWECSVCHKNPCIYVTEDTNFCPSCGAKMDG